MSCPYCRAATAPGGRFCATCGRALSPEPDTIAEAEPAIGSASGPSDRSTSPAPEHRPTPASGWLTSSDSISHGRFAPGAIFDTRYRIISLLGRGGMGEVYRADDLRLGQPVALKLLPEAVGANSALVAQFHNEVRTARQVSHPNICRVYDIGEVEGHLFLSMELVDGEDLASSLRRIGRFPEDKATDIARQLCAGLAAAHERGVLHRDLKPANVMLDGAGKVRVMDFGLAAMGAVENIRAGTPAYMAPEQLLGHEVTAKSDIYALGLVLYELFTGRRAFTAATLDDLLEQHRSGQIPAPRTTVSTLDPSIERAILRCLDPDPARRPTSPLAVSAALPGGDPLAAAIAAGETPSPEMVAAAGEGTGLSVRVAGIVFAAVLAGIAVSYVMALRVGLLDRMRPEYTADVLAQKARDAVRQLGYADRPQDEFYSFVWDSTLIEHVKTHDGPRVAWGQFLSQPPSPLLFRYRRSQQPMVGWQFHHDLLTPGIVTRDDPAPIESGMIFVELDHRGFLISFEAIPPQVQERQEPTPAIDWRPLLTLAGLDPATLQNAEPQWNWLASADARSAWTGTWPGGARSLRVEAAALHGRPVAFQMIGAWTKPWRTTEATTAQQTVVVFVIFLLAIAVVGGGSVLARKNLRENRGDRAGALALGSFVAAMLWAIWICQVHFSPSTGMLGIFLLVICTTVVYAVIFWAIYLALEPFVRRHWPQTLVSWTTILSGRVRDPIVGRDVLVGLALGVLIALLIRGAQLLTGDGDLVPDTLLMGTRSIAGTVLMVTIYAMRAALFTFFLLFLLRVVLRNQWAAALAFVTIFSILNALPSDQPLVDAATTFLYFGMSAIAVLRWGLTSLAIGFLAANLLLILPATLDLSAWYVGATILVLAIPLALASWALYTSVAGRPWKADPFA